MAYRLKKLQPGISLVLLSGVALMTGLGVWQLQRLDWKTNLIARIEEANRTTPVEALPSDAEKLSLLEHYKVRLTGTFIPGKELHLVPRYREGTLGYDIAVPFMFHGKQTILVNRGWVPKEKKELQDRPESAAPKGEVTIEGILRSAGRHNWVTPDNNAEKNLWFWYDIPAMAKSLDEDLLPAIIDITGPQPPGFPFTYGPRGREWKTLPLPNEETVNLRNDHLGYALTWFAIALVGLTVLAAYHLERAEE